MADLHFQPEERLFLCYLAVDRMFKTQLSPIFVSGPHLRNCRFKMSVIKPASLHSWRRYLEFWACGLVKLCDNVPLY
jgi:hypothetical protein